MSSFKHFQRKAGHIADHVVQKGSDLLDTGKIKLSIAKEEHCLDEIYYRIGEAVYENSVETGIVPDYIADECAEIEERKKHIADLKAKLNVEWESAAAEKKDPVDEVIIDITPETDHNKTSENEQ